MKPERSKCVPIDAGLLRRAHNRILKEATEGSPPNLDEDERADPMIQLVVHMRHMFADAGDLFDQHVITCNGLTIVGKGYETLIRDAFSYSKSLVSLLCENDNVSDAEVCAFVLEALSSKIHGFFGHALRSLCATDVFCSSKPLGLQDPAVFLMIKAAMSVTEADAREAARILAQRSPNTLAACGFMTLMVRGPASSSFLTYGSQDASRLGVVFKAMAYCTDPFKDRTAVDIVLATQTGSSDSASSMIASQFHSLAKAWLDKIDFSEDSQLYVGHADAETRRLSLHRLLRSETRFQTIEWTQMVSSVSRRSAKERGLSEEESAIWIDLWKNCHNVVVMSRRLVSRKGYTSAMVAWLYSQNTLYAFARSLSFRTGVTDKWATRCADDFENEAVAAFTSASVVPSMPATRLQKKAALSLPGDQKRWNCLAVDKKTNELLRSIETASQCEDLCVGQGAFRNGSAFAVVSFRQSA